MLSTLLTVTFATLTIISGQDYLMDVDDIPRDGVLLRRQKRFFPLFSVVRFPNSQCTASNTFNGTCFTKRECASQGGTAFGSCANGFGVCCVFQKSCGSTMSTNITYFTNPSYPTTYDGGDRCGISVQKCSSNICQLRVDFLDFTLAQPTSEGVCDYDLLSISGGSPRVPRICGENTDQHMYVDFEGTNPISISIDTSTEYSMKRRWNMRIQQIACDSQMRAPSGCLQYYTSISGSVTSFNYGTSSNPRMSDGGTTGTREMSELNYGVCVKSVSGYCSIKWSAADNAFSISGDSETLTADFGTNCTTDYVIIPNPTEVNSNMDNEPVDRFCGSSFSPKMSTLKPFLLYVVTDNTETESDTGNNGFSLSYKQIICSI
ncbi:hypothetical protein QAD02_008555 [Eretmocerus hayati]|uniref:Uncharacterized protein n=1 Tax=Eretmocerus hayati TaxID=131215 RepID=A0ACC2N6X7_9HYME|nr:hypothetical protein QAD02_008555 [Eretmocerus hayati]